MSDYAITFEEFNLLKDARRHAGFAFALTCGHNNSDTRIELRVSELWTVFSFFEECLAEVLDAAEARSDAADAAGGDLHKVPLLDKFDIEAMMDVAAGTHGGPRERNMGETLERCVEIDPGMDHLRRKWEECLARRDAAGRGSEK